MKDFQDFAERVKKFYYYRALLCEQLINRAVLVEAPGISMPPENFNPFTNFYVDSYVIACAAIDGLASIWEGVGHLDKFSINQHRFTSFLIHLDTSRQMERICTPFLVFSLKKQGIEEIFANEVRAIWIENRHQLESHRVYNDPTILELEAIYQNCHRKEPIPDNKRFKKFSSEISSFTYAALVYKFYRCSFVHEFRSSRFVTVFNKGNEISIRELEKDTGEVKPQLDIGIGVLTESIRRGADTVFNLIMEKQCVDFPYSENDGIKVKVKK